MRQNAFRGSYWLVGGLAWMVLGLAGAGLAGGQAGPGVPGSTVEQPIRRHWNMVAMHEPGEVRRRPGALAGTPTCPSPKLSYFGGPVVSNVQVVPVFWGSAVNARVKANLGQFYGDMANSAHFDMLSEYQTTVPPVGGVGETKQSIGRGSATAGVAITPSICASNCTLMDSDLQAELGRQVAAGKLPEPAFDSAGNSNTVYMVHFPPDVTVNDGFGNLSCQQFCGYHGTGMLQSKPLLYGVIPDHFSGGCSTGCGVASDPLNNETATAAHELAEVVTDPDTGLIPGNFAYPGAWYADDNNVCGEIGDICDDRSTPTITVSGRTWGVQNEWSNALKACVVTGLHPQLALALGSGAEVGVPTSVTLTAMNPDGKTVDSSFVGTVHFTSLDAKAKLPADFQFLALDHGRQAFSVTFGTQGTQTLTVNEAVNGAITAKATVTVGTPKKMPVLTWATPAPIVFGTALSGTQLTATASVPGKFVYSPVAGTVLHAGSQTLTVTFTPTDSVTYAAVARTVSLLIAKGQPKLTWAAPAAIVYPAVLSAKQLDATAGVAGKFVYSPALGAVLQPGPQALLVSFAPTDGTDYAAVSAKVNLTVTKGVPTVVVKPWASTVKAGSSGTVTVTVGRPAGGAVPTGTVSVYWNGVVVKSGPVSATGVAGLTVTAPTTKGTLPLYATYLGDPHYLAEKSASVSVTVGP